jgi:hypothetical protein
MKKTKKVAFEEHQQDVFKEDEQETKVDYSSRSSLAVRVANANSSSDSKKFSVILMTIFGVLLAVHSAAFLVSEFGIAERKNTYDEYTPSQKCLTALRDSKFDMLDTKNYELWMDESSELNLAQTGSYIGPASIREYVEFIKADFFQFLKRSSDLKVTPILLTEDLCSVNIVTTNKAQIKNEYNPANKCLENVIAYTTHFKPEPFMIKNIAVFYPEQYLSTLFGPEYLDTSAVGDYICGIMERNCQEVDNFNFTTIEQCRMRYDTLSTTNEQGYLDDNSKGCRILHSAFAAVNSDHCAHLSFDPMKDPNGNIKCQKSKNEKDEDFFSAYELEKVAQTAHEMGFNETMMRDCDFDPDAPIYNKQFGKRYGFSESSPLESLNDYQFLIYVGIVMYFTMVFAGFGLEYLVWRIVLSGEWDESMEWKWKVAQFVFPILGATTLGLANTGNYLALPFLVVTMWKLGFPESIMLFHSSLYDTNHSWQQRTRDFIIGTGTVVHHSSSALYVAMLVSHVIPSNRDVIAVTLPLVMQHWIVLLKYESNLVYIVLECIIEAWWEWTAFSVIVAVQELHWMGGIIVLSMLFAHWCYFGGGLFGMLLVKEVEEGKMQEHNTKIETAVGDTNRALSALSQSRKFETFPTFSVHEEDSLFSHETDEKRKGIEYFDA